MKLKFLITKNDFLEKYSGLYAGCGGRQLAAKPPMRATEPKAAGFSSYGQRNLRKLSGFGQIAVRKFKITFLL